MAFCGEGPRRLQDGALGLRLRFKKRHATDASKASRALRSIRTGEGFSCDR